MDIKKSSDIMQYLMDKKFNYPQNTYKMKNFAYFCYQGNRVFDLDSVDTSEGTDFSHMFCNCSNVRYMNISELDTSKGTDFSGMFYG